MTVLSFGRPCVWISHSFWAFWVEGNFGGGGDDDGGDDGDDDDDNGGDDDDDNGGDDGDDDDDEEVREVRWFTSHTLSTLGGRPLTVTCVFLKSFVETWQYTSVCSLTLIRSHLRPWEQKFRVSGWNIHNLFENLPTLPAGRQDTIQMSGSYTGAP